MTDDATLGGLGSNAGLGASRYVVLAYELRKLTAEHDEKAADLDPLHALQQCARIDGLVRGLLWLNFQLLRELARRDGQDLGA